MRDRGRGREERGQGERREIILTLGIRYTWGGEGTVLEAAPWVSPSEC